MSSLLKEELPGVEVFARLAPAGTRTILPEETLLHSLSPDAQNSSYPYSITHTSSNESVLDVIDPVSTSCVSLPCRAVFDVSACQDDVYQCSAAPVVRAVLNGYSGVIFAFGQTSSGKTHTMLGPSGGSIESLNPDCAHRGILPRVADEIFIALTHRTTHRTISAAEKPFFSVEVSIYEVYNESVVDLLGASVSSPRCVFKATEMSHFMKKVKKVTISSVEDLHVVLQAAIEQRTSAETLYNQASSRSHLTVSLTVRQWTEGGAANSSLAGRLYLVDLAGSECLKLAGSSGSSVSGVNAGTFGPPPRPFPGAGSGASTGMAMATANGSTPMNLLGRKPNPRQWETKSINSSLLALKKVITALSKRQLETPNSAAEVHIPYKDSVLTTLLRDALNPGCFIRLILTLSTHVVDVTETLSSMRLGLAAVAIRRTPSRDALKHIVLNWNGAPSGGSTGSVPGSACSTPRLGAGKTRGDACCCDAAVALAELQKENQSLLEDSKNAIETICRLRQERDELRNKVSTVMDGDHKFAEWQAARDADARRIEALEEELQTSKREHAEAMERLSEVERLERRMKALTHTVTLITQDSLSPVARFSRPVQPVVESDEFHQEKPSSDTSDAESSQEKAVVQPNSVTSTLLADRNAQLVEENEQLLTYIRRITGRTDKHSSAMPTKPDQLKSDSSKAKRALQEPEQITLWSEESWLLQSPGNQAVGGAYSSRARLLPCENKLEAGEHTKTVTERFPLSDIQSNVRNQANVVPDAKQKTVREAPIAHPSSSLC